MTNKSKVSELDRILNTLAGQQDQFERRSKRKKSKEFPFGKTQITGIGTGRINPAWRKAWDRGEV